MKRLAVLVHGQPRFIKYTWEFIKEEYNIPNIETSYFGHLWDLVGYTPRNCERAAYNKHNISTKIQKDFNSLKIDNYSNLDNFIKEFHPKIKNILHGKNKVVDGNRALQLRYRYGQQYSRQQAHILMEEYERNNNFIFDIVVIIKTDFIYKNRPCCREEAARQPFHGNYIERKEDLYHDLESTSNTVKNVTLCIRPYANGYHKPEDPLNGVNLLEVKSGIIADQPETRIQMNDHFLLCSRDVSQYFCKGWFDQILRLTENIHKDMVKFFGSNYTRQEKADIAGNRISCPFELYGEIVLFNKINAKRIKKHFKRVVNLKNCKEKFKAKQNDIICCKFRDILTEQKDMQNKLIEIFK